MPGSEDSDEVPVSGISDRLFPSIDLIQEASFLIARFESLDCIPRIFSAIDLHSG